MIKQKFLNIYQTYCNKKMLVLTAFGFASGFPFLLVFSTLSLWLTDANWSYRAIGAFSLVKIPYAFKWMWAPLIDSVKIPFLWKMGRRRSWTILINICLFLSLLLMSSSNPNNNHITLLTGAILVSFFSATLDIVLDAYRVELFYNHPENQASGSAIFVLGYRIGLLFSGAGALGFASFLSWNMVYLIMAFGTLVGLITTFLIKEPAKFEYSTQKTKTFREFLKDSVILPITDITSKPKWKWALFFVLIYRLSDSYIGPMSYPFYAAIGFSKLEIAYIIKIYGMAATILGGLYGGLFLKRTGLYQGLYILAWAQGATTLVYALQALIGHHVPMLIITISFENFVSGMATAALVAYLSSLCNILYTATQYALLSSLVALARDLFAATSGILLEATSWPIFFIIAGMMTIPGALVIRKLQKGL